MAVYGRQRFSGIQIAGGLTNFCILITKMAAAAVGATSQDDFTESVLPEVQEYLVDEIEMLVQASYELSERLMQVQERLANINVDKLLGGVPTLQ